jgi:restriction system protein
MTQAWLIRAGRAGERELWALKNGVSGGGFHEVPDMTDATTREGVAELVGVAFNGDKDGRIQNFAAQLWALRDRINVGDYIVMPLKNTPLLAIGQITGGYEYRADGEPDLRHVRPVKWIATDVPRTAVKQDLLYSLGAFLTICEIKRHDAVHRIEVLAQTRTDPGARTPLGGATQKLHHPVGDSDDSEVSDTSGGPIDIEQHAFDRLSSYVIENFAGHRMQGLVAAVLTAEGFTCSVPAEGPDQGVDVLAAKGPLGLDEPRLVVQVKSEAGAVGSPVVQQLLGAMNTHQAQQGLLVAWGGVSKSAEVLLTAQYFRVRVWSSKDLLEAIFRTYDRLPEELQSELPLKRIWALVEEPG